MHFCSSIMMAGLAGTKFKTSCFNIHVRPSHQRITALRPSEMMKLKNSPSQLGRDLSSTLWHLVHIKMEGDAILEAEEATAAVLLEDGLHRQISRFAEEHQQVSIQKPGQSEEWLIMFHRKYVR